MHVSIRKSIALSILLFLLFLSAQAQPVFVKLIYRPGKIPTVFTGLTDTHVLTKDEVFKIEDVLSLVFKKEEPDSAILLKIRQAGIPVYLNNKRYKGIEKDEPVEEFNSLASIGFGAGLDFGGFGAKVSLFPAKPFGLFAGLGSNIVDVGYNAGVDWKFTHQKRNTGFVALMYGYNATFSGEVDGNGIYIKKVFYGLSTMIGGRIRVGSKENYFSAGLIVPVMRDNDFKDFKKTNESSIDIPPVLFSFGFHFGL
jgi:hypothetical protein